METYRSKYNVFDGVGSCRAVILNNFYYIRAFDLHQFNSLGHFFSLILVYGNSVGPSWDFVVYEDYGGWGGIAKSFR